MSAKDGFSGLISPSRQWIINLIFTLIVLSSSRLLLRAIWNILWHPLCAFPGPRLAALSNLYQVYHDVYYKGQMVAHLHDLHRQYGPVVRIGPNELHFSSPEAYKDIYYSGSKFPKYQKFYETMNEEFSSFGSWDVTFHKKRRDTMNPLFSRRAILKYEDTVQDKVNQLIKILSSSKETVDLFSAFRSFTLDIIYDYTYGQDVGAITYPSFAHPVLLSSEAAILASAVGRYFPIFEYIVDSLPKFMQKRLLPKDVDALVDTLQGRATEFVERKAKVQQQSDGEERERETIFTRIVNIEDASWESLFHEGMNLTFAGTDTVANTCFVGCFYVHNDKEILRKVREELRSVWPDPNVRVPYEMLEKLPYLTAVIKESLRLSLGVPVGLPREVQPAAARIMGYDIPRGTIVSMGDTFMHWNPELFPDPHRFDPDRWMGGERKQLDSYLVPFSRGPRQCIGMNLAWCELYLLMGYMFRKLDIEIQDVTLEDMQSILFYFVPVLAGGKHLKGVVRGLLA